MSENNYKYRMFDVITGEVWECSNLKTLVWTINSNCGTRIKATKVEHDMDAVGKYSSYPFYIVYKDREYPPIATDSGLGYKYYHTQAEMWKAKSAGLQKLFDNVNTPVYMMEAINSEIDSCDAKCRIYTTEATDIKSYEEDVDDER